MTEKSFRDQIAIAAKKLGLEFEPRKGASSTPVSKSLTATESFSEAKHHALNESIHNKRFINIALKNNEYKLRIAKKWAAYGRHNKVDNKAFHYTEIEKFIEMLDQIKNLNLISEEDIFYCLTGYLEGSGLNCHLSQKFGNCLIDAAVNASFNNKNVQMFEATLEKVSKLLDISKYYIIKKQRSEAFIQNKREQEKAKSRKLLLPIVAITKRLNSLIENIPIFIPHPKLDRQDILLALLWKNGKREAINKLKFGLDLEKLNETHFKDHEFVRLISARAAEKAAITFYERFGFQVNDISISQLEGSNSVNEWKFYDLDVQGYYHIDVKNSRRSKSSPDRYVEHCIKKFKVDRYDNDIRIAGILSNYLWLDCLLGEQNSFINTEIAFIGETDQKKLSTLKEFFDDELLIIIDFKRTGNSSQSFLPPWVFDMPEFVYKKRDEALKELDEIAWSNPKTWQSSGFQPLPIIIHSESIPETFLKGYELKDWELGFLNDLMHLREKGLLSLSFIYLTILKSFLVNLSNDGDFTDYTPEAYRKFLYFDIKELNKKSPLFIYDPLEIIDELITSLNILWSGNHDLIGNFKIFRLVNYSILQGKEQPADDVWKTLIAYCGGWTESGKCGKNPLVLGNQTHCSECGKLICDTCGFCTQNCPASHSRKRSEREFNSDFPPVDYKIPF